MVYGQQSIDTPTMDLSLYLNNSTLQFYNNPFKSF